MVARGTFTPSNTDYGQVIPYQSSLSGGTAVGSFEACLRTSTSGTGSCPGPSTACDGACAVGATQKLIYSASHASITSTGVNVWVHIDAVTSPVTVSWIYHNGRTEVMEMTNGDPAKDVNLVGNNLPLAVKIPTDLDACNGSHPQYYTIKVNDDYDANGFRNVYYMTFKMTCP